MQKQRKVQVVLINSIEKKVAIFQVNQQRGSFWQNITGSVEPQEDIESGAQRELYEESGIDDALLTPLPLKFNFTDRWGKEVTEFCFLATTTKSTLRISEEHQQYRWQKFHLIHSNQYLYSTNYQATQSAIKKFLTSKRAGVKK